MLNVAIYDPRHLNEDAFIASFVAREDTLNFLVEQLRLAPKFEEPTHRLIVGQRGMGKTSLLRRLAIAVSRSPELAEQYIPLTFREEQYNVRDVEKFWVNCVEALAEWLEQNGQSGQANEIDRRLQCDMHSGLACEYFASLTGKLARRPLLLVDNLDLILDAIPSDQHWQLRRILQGKRGPILYGASSQFLRQSGDRDEAFYEFFQTLQLEALTEAELIKCMSRLVEARGESASHVRSIIDNEPERLRVLHTLTGGNPRVLVLIYQLLERADSDSVFSDLELLLDQLTPFYKSRVEELKSDLQRAIIDAIALNWDPITSNQIAKITGVEVTTISPQLQRLRRQGLIEEVQTSGSRAGYQIVERFLNIWYLMRHGTRRARSRMRWLAAFLQSFYSLDQLRDLRTAVLASKAQSKWRPLYDEAISAAMEKIEEKLVVFSVPSIDSSPGLRPELPGEIVEAELRRQIDLTPNVADAWSKLGALLISESRLSEAEETLRRAVELDQRNAELWYDFARCLEQMKDRSSDAEAAYKRSLEIEPERPIVWSRLGRLFALAKKYDEAEAAFRRAIEIDPASEYGWLGLGTLLEFDRERPAEAEEAYRNVIRINPENPSAWHFLGMLLVRSSRDYDEAEKALRRVVDVDPQHERAWEHLAELLVHRLGRAQDAEAAYRDGLSKNPDSAILLAGLAHVVGVHLDRAHEAAGLYREAIQKDSDRPQIWRDYGSLLGRSLEQYEEAEAAFRKAILLDSNDVVLWDELGDLLSHLGRDDEAEKAYRKALELRPGFHFAGAGLSRLLSRRGQLDDAELLLRQVIELNPNSPALVNLADLLSEDEARLGDAEELYRRALDHYPNFARALVGYAHVLALQHKIQEAESILKRALEVNADDAQVWGMLALVLSARSGDADEIEKAYRRALSLSPESSLVWYRFARFLCDRRDFEGAKDAFQRSIELNPENQGAWIGLGNLLQDHLNLLAEAGVAYQRALAATGDTDLVARANVFWLLVQEGKISEAEELRTQILDLDPVGLALIDAALSLMHDNFGAMTESLAIALADEKLDPSFFDDVLRLFRLALRKGYGDRLVSWMRQSGISDTKAPLFAAFVAFVEGEQSLLDFAPEIRTSAQDIFGWLTSSRPVRKVLKPPRRKRRK